MQWPPVPLGQQAAAGERSASRSSRRELRAHGAKHLRCQRRTTAYVDPLRSRRYRRTIVRRVRSPREDSGARKVERGGVRASCGRPRSRRPPRHTPPRANSDIQDSDRRSETRIPAPGARCDHRATAKDMRNRTATRWNRPPRTTRSPAISDGERFVGSSVRADLEVANSTPVRSRHRPRCQEVTLRPGDAVRRMPQMYRFRPDEAEVGDLGLVRAEYPSPRTDRGEPARSQLRVRPVDASEERGQRVAARCACDELTDNEDRAAFTSRVLAGTVRRRTARSRPKSGTPG